jgi:hypothetical protein
MADKLSMQSIYEGVIEKEASLKLKNLEEAYQDDENRIELLDQALDIVKQACADGELPELNASEVLSLAAELVEGEMMNKEAEAWFGHGETLAFLLASKGVTEEDIEKIATDEDAEDFGDACASLLSDYYAGKYDPEAETETETEEEEEAGEEEE